MGEEITRLTLECLKTDLEIHRLKEERFKLNAEANKLMMETFKDLIPIIPQVIEALVESEGEFSPEMFKGLPKEMPPLGMLSRIREFTKFAKAVSTEALGSLIADLQKIIDDREVQGTE